MRETCGCGASIECLSERTAETFRVDHADCRRAPNPAVADSIATAIREAAVTVSEAILAAEEARRDRELGREAA